MNNKPNDLNKREWDIMVKYTKLFLLMFAVLGAVSGIILILGSMAFIVVEVTNALYNLLILWLIYLIEILN